MKILLINHYAGSPRHGMEFRSYYLAREWIRLGHEVQIVAASNSHVRAKQPQLGKQQRLDENLDGIQYIWFKTPHYVGNGISRVRNMATFIWHLYVEGKTLAQQFKPDVVIASSTYPMDSWPAYRIAKCANAKLVFEVHDLWPLSPIELGGMSKWHPFIMTVQAAENFAYRTADVVVSMLPKVRSYMESRGMAGNKLHIVQNGIDPVEWAGNPSCLEPKIKQIVSNLRLQNQFIVGYAGSHGVANALDTFLDAMKLLKDSNIVGVLVGGGPDKAKLQRRVQLERMENIIFFDPVKKEQIPALLQFFDVAYIGLQRQPLFRFGIAPNKLMDYMMAARPVLMAIDAGNDPVADADCGLTVKPEDPKAIADGIATLKALSNEERNAMGQRGKTYILKNHTYQVLAQKFLTAIS